ncbi:TonB-dependent receptor [Olivibacter sp. XZL3]|uniref:TonB-dependent receptor n=1 Tax=Olivibacter sp. XZL3 TaxID=1735116 RepID=UPI001F111D8F|nr:TonB-dependent receptor [Olivibacter sp. XZL3]
MRIILIVNLVVLTATTLLFAEPSQGQILNKKLNVDFEHIDVFSAIQLIQAKEAIDFAFTDQLQLENLTLAGVHLKDKTLKQVLQTILAGHPIDFSEKNGIVTLYRRQAPGTVRGQVLDENGDPLPGASVKLVEVNRQTSSDAEGRFSLSVQPGLYSLQVNFLAYKPEVRSALQVEEGKTITLQIQMTAEVSTLDEIVVVGYGTQRRKEVTSAVATVKSENFNQGSARAPLELIQGKVAGLNITKTRGNNPNEGTSIQLRGVTSLSGTTTPLIVIDGIPGGNLDLIQQDDIESFDVLKDGSAAAIYGTRGNAGVILITTKKGSAGAPRFEYNNYFQRDYVDKKPDFLSADQFRQKIVEGAIAESNDLGASTDMYDELINRSNLSQYHNFSASGGSANTNYRASLYYNDFEGIAKENSREQFGGRLNINQRGLDDKLDLQINMVANFNKANLLGGGIGDFEQAVSWNPTAPIRNADGAFYEIQENYNPIARFSNRINERDQQTFSGDARLSYQLIPDLKVSIFGSYLRDNYNDRQYRSTSDFEQRVGTQWQGMGYARKANQLNWSKTIEPTVNYEHSWNLHNLSAVAGYSYQYSTSESFNVNNNGFTTDGFYDWNLGAGSAINNTALPRPGMGSFKDDNTLIAFFGRVNYAYQDKYFAQFILRREGSSRFGANHKWGNFPAVSAGWTLSEEAFMQGLPFVDNLKLRVGYGVTGNQGIPNYQSLITLGTGGVYPQNGIYYQTYGPSRNPNPDLKWEKKAEWNFGLDYEVFNHRLSGAIDVYNRNTSDLLYNYAAQQPSFIHSSLYTNVGTIRNRGVELLISAVAIAKKDFQWNIDLTASSQFNRLTKLSNEQFNATFLTFADIPNPGAMGPAIRLYEGGVIGNFYGKRFAGFTDDGNWLFYKADGSAAPATEITENDWAIIGNGVPKYNLGLNQTFRYKNWDLTMLLRGKFGFDILNLQEIFFGNRNYLPRNIFNSAFTRHGELTAAPMYSDYYIEKGDFVKLDNVTLGYNFLLKTAKIRNLRLFVTGRNLLTFTSYSGLDPELQDTGFETGVDSRGFYPRTRSFTAGINVGF